MDKNAQLLQALTDEELADALKTIPGNRDLPRKPIPEIPSASRRDAASRLKDIQSFITSFEYNHTGVSFVKKRRDRGASHVLNTAKELIRESLPIQCVEAVFIALLLTSEMEDLTVYPLSFKSSVGSSKQVYRHIVLAVTTNGKWGALGISRCKELMGKDLCFSSLADLIDNFKRCYAGVCHELLKVYVALPFTRDTSGPIRWRALNLDMRGAWEDICESTRAYTLRGRGLVDYFSRTGHLPPECASVSKPSTSCGQDNTEGNASDGSDNEGADGKQEEEDTSTATMSDKVPSGKAKQVAKSDKAELPKGRVFGV